MGSRGTGSDPSLFTYCVWAQGEGFHFYSPRHPPQEKSLLYPHLKAPKGGNMWGIQPGLGTQKMGPIVGRYERTWGENMVNENDSFRSETV